MTTTAEQLLTTEDLAARVGVIPRTVRAWIGRGMPGARKAGHPPRWLIDAKTAAPWIADNIEEADLGELDESFAEVMAEAAGEAGDHQHPDPPLVDGEVVGIRRHIIRLDRMLHAFTTLAVTGKRFDARIINGIKQVSTELRRLEAHELEMREADDRLMDRRQHERAMATLTRLVVDEIDAWKRSTPDAVIDALTSVKVKVAAKRTAKVLDATLDEKAAELRTRIAELIDQAEEIT